MPKPQLSVNGRLNPVVKMRPGEVQLWRIVNGAFRDAVQFQSFCAGGAAWPGVRSRRTACSSTSRTTTALAR